MKNYTLWLTLGILSGFLWGCNNYLYDVGVRALSMENAGLLLPLICTAVNDMSAAVFLLLVNGLRGTLCSIHKAFNRSGAFLCLGALLGGPIGQLSYCIGIIWAGPAYALALSALYPVVGCILAHFFLHQRMNSRMRIGIALAVAGAIITGFTPPEQGQMLLPGVLCAVFAAFCWGSEIVLAVRGMDDIGPDLAITIRETISGVVLLIVTCTVFSGSVTFQLVSAEPKALGTLAVAGVIAGTSYFLWYAVNCVIGCACGMAANATYIIWGALLQWGLGHHEPSGQLIVGCIFVFVGVFMVSLYPRKAEMIL